MTIQERTQAFIEKRTIPKQAHQLAAKCYINGAIEQRKIDIDKACDLVYDQIVALIGYTEEAKNIAYKYFRKEMEEEQ